MLEACKAKQYPLKADQEVQLADWEKGIQQIAKLVLADQSAKRLFEVRSYLYELLVNCIPPDVVIRTLANELLEKVDTDIKHELCHSAAFFEQRLQQGSKPIFHIEAFLADFMARYKDFMATMIID
jgi:replication factor C subunit 3/5